MRVAVLQNIVAPTRHALFQALAEQPGVESTVLFMAHNEPTRGWREEAGINYPHVFMPGLHLPLARRGDVDVLHLNPSVVSELWRGRFDVVLCGGWLSPTSWLALGASLRTRLRLLLWFGSTEGGPARPLKRLFIRWSDGFVVYGEEAQRRLTELGAPPERVTIALNTTDVEPFAAAARDRAAARAALGVDGRVALISGRLVARKRVPRALALLARVAERVPELQVVVAGDGPERDAVVAEAERLRLDARFLGERAYADLPALYAAADVLVTLAEREPWGLVVNEALAAGVPVLATPDVTAAVELVEPGAGLVSDDDDALAAWAVAVLRDAGALAAARAAAQRVLPRLLPAEWATQVAAAASRAAS